MRHGALLTTAALAAAASLSLPELARAEVTFVTSPSPVVLGKTTEVLIEVRGLVGRGPVRTDANLGTVKHVEETLDGTIRIHYQPPARAFPQRLCLALWRDTKEEPKLEVVRVPLLAETRIPVETRRHSEVSVEVADRVFGPFSSGATGRTQVTALVPPGTKDATVRVRDDAGLETSKKISVQTPSYNLLAMALLPGTGKGALPSFRIAVSTAEEQREPVLLQVGADLYPLTRTKSGWWAAHWAPSVRPKEGPLPIKVWLPGHSDSVRYAQVTVSPAEFTLQVLRVRPTVGWKTEERLKVDLGLSMGLLHNLGDLAALRIGVELSGDYPLRFGRIGLRLFSGFARAAQQVPGPAGLPEAESSINLVQVGGGVTYRVADLWVTPYAMAGGLVQLIQTSNSAEYAGDRVLNEWAPGFLALAGGERRVGPGKLFLQIGYLWSRVEGREVAGLTGGLILDGGYRVEL